MDSIAERLATELRHRGLTIAVAESLTSGALASAIGAAPHASKWFRGGLVAYMDDVKFGLLGVTPGPVVTDRCAREMAAGARERFSADVGVAVTGVGGPGEEEGKPEGTVFLAAETARNARSIEHHFAGEPQDVLRQTIDAALDLALEVVVGR